MGIKQLGYSWIISQNKLKALPLKEYSRIDTATRGRERTTAHSQVIQSFEPSYQPDDTLQGQLQFALKYEGINLQVLALLFNQSVEEHLKSWITSSPASIYARRACFLYEWIVGETLSGDISVPSREKYISLVDEKLQFALRQGQKDTRYRVLNNLPGTADFCPMVRKTGFLREMVESRMQRLVTEIIEQYDPGLLKRAAAFLYLKETQSSFELEREQPSPDKAQRFADMLRQADYRLPLTSERFSLLQNAALDPRFHEFTWRSKQNWVGKDLGYRKQIDFIPARPEHLESLMNGLIGAVSKCTEEISSIKESGQEISYDPIVLAAIVSFGFVYIHPFMDGNGRIHRYLIHDILTRTKFTPAGIILPVSAVILANLDDYIDVLESFSRPLRDFSEYNPDVPTVPATGNDTVYFKFFDATPQAEFLYAALKRTLEKDLQEEIEFLRSFDKAFGRLNQQIDWPSHSLELFIRLVHQNGGTLSNTKMNSHFSWMSEAEIERSEDVVQDSFSNISG